MQKISNLRGRIKDSEWFDTVFEERLDDQYLKRFLRVTKMNEDDALERLRKMFALQKGRKSIFQSKNFLLQMLVTKLR